MERNLVCDKNLCNKCGVCQFVCPKSCITILDNLESNDAIIDESKCINCHLCKKNCPRIVEDELKVPQKWQQGWARNLSLREKAASGGIASAIFESFIKQGGIVYSCGSEHTNYDFIRCSELKDLEKLSGSKYVKSNPQKIYLPLTKDLKKDKKVLFCGLPCQVAAVKNLTKNPENLYTIDLICHGTPSDKILKLYLEEKDIKLTDHDKLTFRTGNKYNLLKNAIKIDQKNDLDAYTYAFLKGLSYTHNCYSCRYAQTLRVSDLTLGDSWGSELVQEHQHGLSIILTMSDKGSYLLNQADLELFNVNTKNAIKNNHQLSKPTENKRKWLFWKILKASGSFEKAVEICYPVRKLKRIIKDLNCQTKCNVTE